MFNQIRKAPSTHRTQDSPEPEVKARGQVNSQLSFGMGVPRFWDRAGTPNLVTFSSHLLSSRFYPGLSGPPTPLSRQFFVNLLSSSSSDDFATSSFSIYLLSWTPLPCALPLLAPRPPGQSPSVPSPQLLSPPFHTLYPLFSQFSPHEAGVPSCLSSPPFTCLSSEITVQSRCAI